MYIQKYTAHTNFSNDALIDAEINDGKWRDLASNGLLILIFEIRNIMFENYDMNAAIVDCLEFCYTTIRWNNGNTKLVVTEVNIDIFRRNKIPKERDSTLSYSSLLLIHIIVKVRKNWVTKSKKTRCVTTLT